MNDSGTIVWQLLLCLVLTYVVIFLCLSKGIKSAGKVNNRLFTWLGLGTVTEGCVFRNHS